MITYDDIVYFDTETTGLLEKGMEWQTDYLRFPRICQLSWIYKGVEENHIIRPDGWEIPQEATAVHGITTEYALEHGEPIQQVLQKFMADCSEAKLICGHNIYFDISITKSELMRYGLYESMKAETALFKGKRIDTMRPAMKFVDARFSNGRLKFPRLEELYAKCFNGETFPAHDAIEDVRAVVRCLPVLVENGIIELIVKDYETEQTKIPFAKTAINAPQSQVTPKVDTLPTERKQSDYRAKQEKITNTVAALMADDLF